MSADFLDKDIVYVSSSDRISGTSNDFIINLCDRIKTPNNYDTVSLINFSCPKSYYLFNSLNNRFIVIENGNQTVITIPIGNYDFYTLTNELNTLLSACVYTYQVTNSQLTGKFLFTVSNNNNIQPSIDFNTANSAYKILGFDKLLYTFAGNTLSSANIVNLQLTNTVRLCANFIYRGTLATIIPNIADFSMINYNEYNPNFTSHSITNTSLGNVRFWLLDGITNNPLNLNGLDWFCTFAIYKKNSYYEHMIEDTKMQAEIADITMRLSMLDNKNK